MTIKYYTGTAEQALAYADDSMRRWHEDKQKAEDVLSLEDALDDLIDEIESLAETCRNASKDDLLNAQFQFCDVQSKFNIVKIKVNEEYDEKDEDYDEDEDYDDELVD